MIPDNQSILDEAVALTASGVSGSTFDLAGGAKLPDGSVYVGNPAVGEPLELVVFVTAAPVGTGTYVVNLQTAAALDGNNNLSSATTLGSVTIPATAKVGDTFRLPLSQSWSYKQYLAASYTLGGTSPAISLTAMLMPTEMVGQYTSTPSGSKIL